MNETQQEALMSVLNKYDITEYTLEADGLIIAENDDYVVYGRMYGDLFKHNVTIK